MPPREQSTACNEVPEAWPMGFSGIGGSPRCGFGPSSHRTPTTGRRGASSSRRFSGLGGCCSAVLP